MVSSNLNLKRRKRDRKWKRVHFANFYRFLLDFLQVLISYLCLSPFAFPHSRQSRVLLQLWTNHKNIRRWKSLVVITDHSVFTFMKALDNFDLIHLKLKPITHLFCDNFHVCWAAKWAVEITRWQQLSSYGVVRVLTARRGGQTYIIL